MWVLEISEDCIQWCSRPPSYLLWACASWDTLSLLSTTHHWDKHYYFKVSPPTYSRVPHACELFSSASLLKGMPWLSVEVQLQNRQLEPSKLHINSRIITEAIPCTGLPGTLNIYSGRWAVLKSFLKVMSVSYRVYGRGRAATLEWHYQSHWQHCPTQRCLVSHMDSLETLW